MPRRPTTPTPEAVIQVFSEVMGVTTDLITDGTTVKDDKALIVIERCRSRFGANLSHNFKGTSVADVLRQMGI